MEMLFIILSCLVIYNQTVLLKDIVKERKINHNLELNNRLLASSIIDEGKYLPHVWEYLGVNFTRKNISFSTYKCAKCSMIHRVCSDLEFEGFYVNGAKSIDFGCRQE